jgi:DNA-binding transcriptional LysR family regulator
MSMTSPSPTGIRAALHAGIAATVMPTASVDPGLRVLGESDGLPSPGTVTVVAHRSALAKGMALEAFIEQLRVSL